MAELIAATVNATTSAAFAISGSGKLIVSGLAGNEVVKLLEEFPDGQYRHANDRDGIGVTLSVRSPSIIVEGYGNYKVSKPVTGAAVAVWFNE